MTRLLVENGLIVTLEQPNRVLPNHGILAVNGTIERIVAPGERVEADEVVDAQGMLVMPGLINAHMHCYSAFACGLTKAEPAHDFVGVLRNLWWRLDRQLTLGDVASSAELACIAAIRAGTTTFIDHHASPFAAEGSLAQIAAVVRQSGLRAALCYELSDRDGADIRARGHEENLAFMASLAADPDPHLAAMYGLHASFTLETASLERAALAAKAAGVGCHIHLAEDAADQRETLARFGSRVVPRLAAAGVLGPKSICAHAVHLEPAEADLLAESGTIVTHQPQSNMNNAVGVMNLALLLERGVTIALGTDAMTQNMLEEARAALFLHKLARRDPAAAFGEVLDMLLVRNPELVERQFGLRTGRLAPGYAADLRIVDYQPGTPLEADNFGGHLLFGISQAKVDTTICNGRVLMRHGQLTVFDERAVCALARERAAALWRRF